MPELTPDDVAAMRQQGDFRAFLRSISAPASRVPAPRPAPKPEQAQAPERDPGHRPGAWPAGTRRPAPNTTHIDDWQQPLAHYREWLLAGSPTGHYPCDCGTCPKGDTP